MGNKSRVIGLLILLAVIGIGAAYLLLGGGAAPAAAAALRGYVGGEKIGLLEDPEVQAILADDYRLTLDYAKAGSLDMVAADQTGRDFLFPSSQNALEYYQQTGQKISEHNEAEREKESAYNSAYFVLTDDRKILYDRIDKRVDLMMQEGLLEEVNALRLRGLKRESVAMQGLGYKELFGYFEGEYPLEEAVRIIKRDTRHFAKRQLTWFRRERDVIWLDKSEIGREDKQLIQQMLTVLKEKEIIH